MYNLFISSQEFLCEKKYFFLSLYFLEKKGLKITTIYVLYQEKENKEFQIRIGECNTNNLRYTNLKLMLLITKPHNRIGNSSTF